MHVNAITLAFHEFINSIKGKARKIVIVTVALIPLLYGALYLWAFTDPYRTLDTVPVAVVVQDRGALFDGKTRNIGFEIKDRLRELSKSGEGFQWNFVNKHEANKGIKNGKYFMVATIPASFSNNIASAQYDTPMKAKLHIKYDQASNMLASQIGKTVFHAIRSEISEAITQEYLEHVFGKINLASNSLKSAVKGTDALGNGTVALKNGIDSLNGGTHKLSQSMNKLKDGLGSLQIGANSLTQANVRSAKSGKFFAQKIQNLSDGTNSLNNGTQHLAIETNNFYKGMQKLAFSTDVLKNRVSQVNADADRQIVGLFIKAQNPSVTKEDVLNDLQNLAIGLGKNSQLLQSNISALDQGANVLSENSLKINNAVSTLSTAISNMHDSSVKLADGANKLGGGRDKISRCSEKLNSGINSAVGGYGKIVAGSDKLKSGVEKMSSNTPKLVNGVKKLHDGLNKAQKSSKVKNVLQKSKMMSSPVQLQETNYSKVKNYGSGFAPYFISIALWVGALIATFILRVTDRRALLNGMNPIISTLISFTPFAIMAIAQTLILLITINFALNLQVDNIFAFYSIGIISALTFMAIMQMIMSAFKMPGRIVAIILLMLQITSSAGTFPIEMTPKFFRIVHPFLPITYSTMGLRQAMAGKNYDCILTSIGMLIIFAVISIAITSVKAIHMQNVRITDLHPVITLR